MVYTRPPGTFQRAYKRKQYGLPILTFGLCASHRSLLFFKVSRKEPWHSNFSCRLTVSHPKEVQVFLGCSIVVGRETRKVHTGFYLTEI